MCGKSSPTEFNHYEKKCPQCGFTSIDINPTISNNANKNQFNYSIDTYIGSSSRYYQKHFRTQDVICQVLKNFESNYCHYFRL